MESWTKINSIHLKPTMLIWISMTEVAYKTWNEQRKAYICMELRSKSKENISIGKKACNQQQQQQTNKKMLMNKRKLF